MFTYKYKYNVFIEKDINFKYNIRIFTHKYNEAYTRKKVYIIFLYYKPAQSLPPI